MLKKMKKQFYHNFFSILSDEFSAKILDTADLLIIVLDLKANIIKFNKFAEKITGFSEEEVLGKNWMNSFFLKQNSKLISEAFDKLISKEQNTLSFNTPILCKKGLLLNSNWQNSLIEDDHGDIKGFLCIGLEISPQIQEKSGTCIEDYKACKKSKYDTEEPLIGDENLLYRDLVEKAKIAIAVDDSDGNMIYFNNRFPNLFGYTSDEIKYKSHKTLIHPDDLEMVSKNHTDRLSGKSAPTNYVCRCIRKDSSIIYIEVEVYEVLRKDGKLVGTRSYIWDITDRKRTEIALKNSEQKFRSFVESSQDLIFRINKHARIDYISPRSEELFGYKPEELVGKRLRIVTPKEDIRKTVIILKQIFKGKPLFNHEMNQKHRSGKIIPMEVNAVPIYESGKIIGLQGIMRDITERKRADEDLRKLSRAVEYSPSSIVISDLEGNVEYVNPKFCEISGYSKDEIMGENLRILKSGDLSEKMYNQLWETIRSGKEWRGEFHNKKKNGEMYWETASISPVLNKKGKIINYIKVAEDITEHKINEAKYKAIFETTGTATMIVDNDTTIINVNQECEFLTGFKAKELIGSSWTKYIHPDELNLLSRRNDARIQNPDSTPYRYETRVIVSDGDVHNVVLSVGMIPGTTRQTVSILDITERIKTTQLLKENEEKYRNLFQKSNDAIIIHDFDDNIIEINQKAVDLFGYSYIELLRMKFNQLKGSDIENNAQYANKKIIEDGHVNFDLEFKKHNGETIYTEISSSIFDIEGTKFIQAIIRDVTSRKRNDQIQSVLYNITRAANVSQKLENLFQKIHEYINTIIDCSNFFIALYDLDEDIIKFPYYIDEKDAKPDPVPVNRSKGLTQFVWNTGKSLLAEKDRYLSIAKKENIEFTGTLPEIWLGIPLRIEERVLGVMVLQNYDQADALTDEDLEILDALSYQVAVSIEHKQIEQTNLNLSEIIKNSTDGIILTNPEGNIKYVNPAFEEMSGYALKELINTDPQDLIIKEISTDSSQNIRPIVKNLDKWKGEMYCRRKNGEIYPIETSVFSIKNLKGEIVDIAAVQQDITEKKQAENALRESEEKLRNIINNTTNVFYSETSDRKIKYISPQIFNLLGFTPEEVLEKGPVFASDNPINKRGIAITDKAISTGIPQPPFELELNHKNGNKVIVEVREAPVVEDGKTVSVVGALIDITKRKQAEKIQKTMLKISSALNSFDDLHQLLKEIRKILSNIINTTNFCVALYESKNDMIEFVYYDDVTFDKKDYLPPKRKSGKGLTEYVVLTRKPLLVSKQMQNELAKLDKVEIIGARSEVWLGVPLKVGKQVIGVIAVQSYDNPNLYSKKDIDILTFISEEIAIAMQRKKSVEYIKNSLEEKDTLVRELYHRTKNNMQVISSLLRIQSRNSKNSFIRDSFKEIINKINAMSLVHQKLYQSKDLSRINLKEYILDLLNQVKRSFSLKAEYVLCTYDMEDFFIMIDTAIPCGLVLNELFSNIYKHAFPDNTNGEIYIKMYVDDNDFLNIQLDDNGIGIPPDQDLRKMHSMGVQLVFSLIERQLKGRVEYASENGLKWHLILKDNLYTSRVRK